MATYNWYFSMSGGGNVFSQTSPGRWLSSHQVGYIKGETTAQDKIDSVNVNDTVNLFFKRGDTWSMDTAKVSKTIIYGLLIDTNSPIVHINAYASGNKPIFDGLVSNFSVAPVHNSTTGPLFYNQLFQFKRNNCSISNIEIKRVYGHGIILSNGNYFTLDSSYIHHFGAGGVSISSSTGGNNITVTKNVFHTGQELYHYGLRSGWEAAIQLTAQDYIVEDNIIQYNVVYDIYGEGIQCPNSLCEYNIVGDTGSIALNTSNHGWDAKTTIVRYNIVTMSDWDSNIYDSLNGSSPIGIRVFDEHIGGDNSNADIQIYGNIIINAKYGIKLGSPVDRGNPYGFVKIYNNTMIDCEANWCFSQPEEFSNVYIYNNSSIHYNKACAHIINWDISEGYNGWNISHNHFYPVDNINTVLPIFTNNYLTMNPKLIGGDIVDWTGQSGPTYFKDIKFSDLYPMADSPLIGSGKPLGIGFDNIFLTKGSDFSTLPNVPKFILAMQPEVGNWDIGAIITSGINLCAGVVCDNICIGNDLWSQK
ncbi:MAG: right-handed parallel beta-helix repeat-containing protein, partial [Thermoplasmata archaeon]|nr:right-handed parallel beta-helix repeat-containing protein [Thermoplasmata archaeon]